MKTFWKKLTYFENLIFPYIFQYRKNFKKFIFFFLESTKFYFIKDEKFSSLKYFKFFKNNKKTYFEFF